MKRSSLYTSRVGVTLVELLVVIAIIGLMAGIAVGALGPRSNQNTHEASDSISKLLISARAEAVKKRHSVVVRLDDGASTRSATALADGSIIIEGETRARIQQSVLTGSRDIRNDKATDRQ